MVLWLVWIGVEFAQEGEAWRKEGSLILLVEGLDKQWTNRLDRVFRGAGRGWGEMVDYALCHPRPMSLALAACEARRGGRIPRPCRQREEHAVKHANRQLRRLTGRQAKGDVNKRRRWRRSRQEEDRLGLEKGRKERTDQRRGTGAGGSRGAGSTQGRERTALSVFRDRVGAAAEAAVALDRGLEAATSRQDSRGDRVEVDLG